MNKKIFFLLTLIILSCSSSPDGNQDSNSNDQNETPSINENYFKVAFGFPDPNLEVLHDEKNSLVIIASKENGKLLSYDYKNHESLILEKDFPVYHDGFGLFSSDTESELYVGNINIINIYNSKTFEFIDSINLIDENESILSIESTQEKLLFISIKNNSSTDDKIYCINRTTKQIVSEVSTGSSYMLRLFKTSDNKNKFIGAEALSSGDNIALYNFSEDGNFIDRISRYPGINKSSSALIKLIEPTDFFIIHRNGNVFNRNTLEYISTLPGDWYRDFLFKDSSKIYALTLTKLQIIDSNSMTLIEEIDLPGDAGPRNIFRNNGKIIIVYFRPLSSSNVDIYMSIFDESEL